MGLRQDTDPSEGSISVSIIRSSPRGPASAWGVGFQPATYGGTYASCIHVQKFLNSIPKSKCVRAGGVCPVEGPSCHDLLIGWQPFCAPS